jgi:RNA polymerase sigma-54 factor
MRFDYSQQMRLGQHMKLAPRMIQSMEILQMPLAELQERIEQELENNPTLEISERHGDKAALEHQREDADRDAREGERPLRLDEKDGVADFERLDSYEASNPEAASNEYSGPAPRQDYDDLNHAARRRQAGEDEYDAVAAAPDRGRPLSDQLLDQWRMAEADEGTKRLGELIVNFLEEDGSLKTPLATIADRAPAEVLGPGSARPSEAQLEQALGLLQRALEPAGLPRERPASRCCSSWTRWTASGAALRSRRWPPWPSRGRSSSTTWRIWRRTASRASSRRPG